MTHSTKTIGDLFGNIQFKGECSRCGHGFESNAEHVEIINDLMVCARCTLAREIDEITQEMRGPMPDAERMLLYYDRKALRQKLERMTRQEVSI